MASFEESYAEAMGFLKSIGDQDSIDKLSQLNNAVAIIGNIVAVKKKFEPSFINYKSSLSEELQRFSNEIKPKMEQNNIQNAKQMQQVQQTQQASWVNKNCRFAGSIKNKLA